MTVWAVERLSEPSFGISYCTRKFNLWDSLDWQIKTYTCVIEYGKINTCNRDVLCRGH
jgi:hypothetical protein